MFVLIAALVLGTGVRAQTSDGPGRGRGPGASTSASASPAPMAQLRHDWVTALEAQNLEASLALYAADANFINPDGTHTKSAAELRKLYTTVFAAFTAKIKLVSRTTGQSGNLAYDSGSYTETLAERGQPAGQGFHAVRGDYLTLYRHDPDDRWRIVQQVWTQAPPASAVRTTG